MSSTGYIGKDGKYVRATRVPVSTMVEPLTSTWKQGDHHRQRFDHAAEIIQPYKLDGTPNEEMIEAWPDEAVNYGFLPGELLHDPDAARSAEGSTPYGQ